MGFNRRLSRHARNILTFILAELACIFCGSFGLFYVYPRVSPLIGRIADFRPMQDGYHIPDTAYSFVFAPSTDSYSQVEVMLVNDLTGSKTAIMSLGWFYDQGFTLLHHRDQTYLLLKG